MNVCIAGAGVIGASIAYHLALRGVGARIIERTGVANAASGKSGGFLARDWCEGTPQDALARLSFDMHQDLADRLGTDYGYRRLDTYAVGVSDRRAGVKDARPGPQWLDGRGVIQGRLGSRSSTAQVDPARFTQALIGAACERGAQLQMGCVQGLAQAPSGRLTGVKVDGQLIQADRLIIAMGPWSILASQWIPLPGVYGLKGYSIRMLPHKPLPAEALFVDYEDASGERHGPEIVPRADGEVYMCGFSDQSALPVDPSLVQVDMDACNRLHRVAAMLCSSLGEAHIAGRQACYRPICQDAMPIMGEVTTAPGVFVASGHNCWGMLNAPASGLAMADLICDGVSSTVDLAPFSVQRLPVLATQSHDA